MSDYARDIDQSWWSNDQHDFRQRWDSTTSSWDSGAWRDASEQKPTTSDPALDTDQPRQPNDKQDPQKPWGSIGHSWDSGTWRNASDHMFSTSWNWEEWQPNPRSSKACDMPKSRADKRENKEPGCDAWSSWRPNTRPPPQSQLDSPQGASSMIPPPRYAEEDSLATDTRQWTRDWLSACRENESWLAMGFADECLNHPWCMLCGQWADEGHLKSERCRNRRKELLIVAGPELRRLLNISCGVSPIDSVSQSRTRPCIERQNSENNASHDQLGKIYDSFRAKHFLGETSHPTTESSSSSSSSPAGFTLQSCGHRRLKCLHYKCDFPPHPDPQYEGYCCGACRMWAKNYPRNKPQHGKACKGYQSPGPAPPDLRTVNVIENNASGNEVEWLHLLEPVDVQEGIHIDSRHVRQLEPPGPYHLCKTIVIISQDSAGETACDMLVLRANVQPDGWISIAHFKKGGPFSSKFRAPAIGWNAICRKAENLCDFWTQVDTLWLQSESCFEEYSRAQASLHEAVRSVDRVDLRTLMDERNALRSSALLRLEEYLLSARKACQDSHGWNGGCRREQLTELAEQRKADLGFGENFTSQIDSEMEDLKACKRDLTKAKVAKRSAETSYKNACDLEDNDQAREALEELHQRRDEARKQERLHFRKVSRLCHVAARHAPEILPEIIDQIQNVVKLEIKKLVGSEKVSEEQVLEVLTTELDLSHYDGEFKDENRLSGKGARHAVYKMSYDGKDCVLKVFDLREHRALPGFLKEVMLHVRLKHPLVVPLRRAFLDWDEHRGFLHFDRYPNDLDGEIHKLSSGCSISAAWLPDRVAAVRRIVHAMIESINHVHSHGIVHGDIKPSNWLWNDQIGLPCVCDFETSREQGCGTSAMCGASTTGVNLHTSGYMAPELVDNPTLAKTKASDVYACGRSIEKVVKPILDPRRNSPEIEALQKMIHDMCCNNPKDRITIEDASQRWWSSNLSVSDGITTQVSCKEILFTQRDISTHFTNGRPLNQLVDAVVADPELPLRDERLVLDVIVKDGKYGSLDNRRLWCFTQAQRKLQPTVLWIRVKLHQASHIWERWGQRRGFFVATCPRYRH